MSWLCSDVVHSYLQSPRGVPLWLVEVYNRYPAQLCKLRYEILYAGLNPVSRPTFIQLYAAVSVSLFTRSCSAALHRAVRNRKTVAIGQTVPFVVESEAVKLYPTTKENLLCKDRKYVSKKFLFLKCSSKCNKSCCANMRLQAVKASEAQSKNEGEELKPRVISMGLPASAESVPQL